MFIDSITYIKRMQAIHGTFYVAKQLKKLGYTLDEALQLVKDCKK